MDESIDYTEEQWMDDILDYIEKQNQEPPEGYYSASELTERYNISHPDNPVRYDIMRRRLERNKSLHKITIGSHVYYGIKKDE